MEKYARQAVSEGVKNADDLRVGGDSEIYRVLNLHYNRNNHIEVWGPQVRNWTEHAQAFYFIFHLTFCKLNFTKLIFWYIYIFSLILHVWRKIFHFIVTLLFNVYPKNEMRWRN